MNDYDHILDLIRADDRYQRNLDWGKPRAGHPEGSIRQHIHDLEQNLDRLRSKLTDDETAKLRILIHVHDTLKGEAREGVAITDSQSYASLAKKFLSDFCTDPVLLTIMQYHDEPYALWKKHLAGRDPHERLERLITTITDWDLFLAFLIVDGCTAGKSREPLLWFFQQIRERIKSRVSAEWIIEPANQMDWP